jgi:hypothetical protein
MVAWTGNDNLHIAPHMTSTSYSIAAASRLVGKSRNTISKDLKEGKLSCEQKADGSKLIDAAELIRVYGDAFRLDRGGEHAKPVSTQSRSRSSQPANDAAEVAVIREKLETFNQERDRERKQLQDRIDSLEAAFTLLQETHHRTTMLLENRSGGGDWEKLFTLLERRYGSPGGEPLGTRKAEPEEPADRPPAAKPATEKSWKDKNWFQVLVGW